MIFIPSCYNILFADGDREKLVRGYAERGATHMRFFAYCAWDKGGSHNRKDQPFLYLRQTDGGYPGTGSWPFWAATKWNEDWWARYRAFLGWLKKYGLGLYLVVGDYSSLKYKGALKRLSPYYSCDEKYNPDKMADEGSNEFAGGIWDKGFDFIWDAFRAKLKAETEAILGDNYVVEDENEGDLVPDGYGSKDDTEEQKEAKRNAAWRRFYRHGSDWWTAHGIPKSRLVSTSGRLSQEVADYIAPGLIGAHGHSIPSDIDKRITKGVYWGGLSRAIISCDGGYGGHGHADFLGRKCCNAEEARGLAQETVRHGAAGIEFFPFECEGPSTVDNSIQGPGPIFNCDLIDWSVIDAFRDGLGLNKYVFAYLCPSSNKIVNDFCPEVEWPTKFIRGQQPTDICLVHHAPTPEPEPQPQPEPVKPLSLWEKFRRWIRKILGIDKGPGK